MRARIFLSGLMIVLLAVQVAAQNRKVYPVDEAAKDRSFKVFRDRLLKAARAKDKEFILSILDPNIHLGFDGSYGPKDFKTMWKIDEPNSEFWGQLTAVLKLGGAFKTVEGHREFIAPYVTSQWPDSMDVFEYVAVIGINVRLRASPGLSAPVLASLSYDIVRIFNTPTFGDAVKKDGINWLKVKTLNGQVGYVAEEYIRSSVNYRAYFRKIKGNWRMTAFIAGD